MRWAGNGRPRKPKPAEPDSSPSAPTSQKDRHSAASDGSRGPRQEPPARTLPAGRYHGPLTLFPATPYVRSDRSGDGA